MTLSLRALAVQARGTDVGSQNTHIKIGMVQVAL